MSSEPTTEQAIKALQAQNAQFQELVMSLAQGQQELKTLIQKKKKKKRTVLFNPRRRYRKGPQNEADQATSSVGKDSPQGGRAPSPVVSENETDYNDEQYPPAEDRYRTLHFLCPPGIGINLAGEYDQRYVHSPQSKRYLKTLILPKQSLSITSTRRLSLVEFISSTSRNSTPNKVHHHQQQ